MATHSPVLLSMAGELARLLRICVKPSCSVTGSPTFTRAAASALSRAPMSSHKILELGHLLALFVGEQVDRLAGDGAEHRPLVGPDGQLLADQHDGIPAADRLHVEEALLVDVLHQKADLVAVPGQHDPQAEPADCGPTITLPCTSVVTGRQTGDVLAHDLLHRLLIARGTGRFQQATQKIGASAFIDKPSGTGGGTRGGIGQRHSIARAANGSRGQRRGHAGLLRPSAKENRQPKRAGDFW